MSSLYGIDRFLSDLTELGYFALKMVSADNVNYAVIPNYEVPVGRFQGRLLDLGIPVPSDYPRLVGASMHIKATPQLLDYSDTIPNIRNIISSQLGSEWRYWSFRFETVPDNTAHNLILQINGIFQRI